MRNIKYIIYINGQSTKPLVNSVKEAKHDAELHIKYKPSLRVECYSAPITACVWIYDYNKNGWVKVVDHQEASQCCLAAECKQCS